MKIKTDYEGMTLTDKYLTIHFKLEVGGTLVRHSTVKVRAGDLPEDLLLQALDRTARRKLIEIWSDEPLAPWDE